MAVIESVNAWEILDSRGRPTVKASCTLKGGASAAASVPSGASTGAAEAHELRDGDPKRYRGLGCLKAVANVVGPIADAVTGRTFADQAAFDHALIALDGSEQKSHLGANAILAASIAFARASAVERGLPLYQHFADMAGRSLDRLPRLTINLFSGGKHAGGQVAIQDVLLVPTADTIDAGLASTWAIYQAAVDRGLSQFQMRPLSADEGGLAPPFTSARQMLEEAVAAMQAADFTLGDDACIAVDVASSHFYRDGRYDIDGQTFDAAGMIDLLDAWAADFPIVSIEDGLNEDAWSDWPALRQRLAGRCLTLGDDFLCTNPARIRKAIAAGAADALLLKVNQIGTLTEAGESLRLAREAGWRVTISARSGETEDDWLADLAVGWGGDQIKIGSITQSERLAKYNRLLEIEAETGLPVVNWPRA